MKIALIGPTYPYRGGIAHYSTLLCEALRKRHEVKFISFSRMFPAILYPGKSDRDTSCIPVKIDAVDYLIDSLNPLSWLKTSLLIKQFRPDKIIFPWWISYLAPHYWTIITFLPPSYSEIIFICHNVIDHESNGIKKKAARFVFKKAHTFITHSGNDSIKLKNFVGMDIKTITAFHPTYSIFNIKHSSKKDAKRALKLKRPYILLFFGFVRPYKGLDVLLKAMREVVRQKDVTLLIAGEFRKDKWRYLNQINNLKISNHVRIFDKYIPNEEIGIYFYAADLVVQPYITGSGSGVCQMAYGFDTPVIATNVGSAAEVVQDRINGRIVKSGHYENLSQVIIESLDPHVLDFYSNNAVKTKERFSWDRLVEIIIKS